MSETEQNYAIGYGKPPKGRRFQKGQSGNPRGPRGRPGKNNLSALLLAALDEPVYVTIDGHRRKITKREAIVTQMVDKSAAADLRATKMLIDMLKEVEAKAGTVPPGSAELTGPAGLTAPDREVVDLFVARLRRQIAAEAAAAAAEFVVPAKAGTQEQAAEAPLFEPGASSGFPLARE
jgi:hypothetical protein